MTGPARDAGDAGAAKPHGGPLRHMILAVILLIAGVSRTTARADDLSALFDPGTVVSVGALAGASPRFQGSRRTALWGLPYLSFRRADEAPEWWSPDDGLDADLVGAGPLRAGPVLDLREGRSARDTQRVAGVPTRPLTVGLGLFGELWLVEDMLRLRAEITQGVRARDGVLIRLAGDAVGRFGRFTLSGGPRLVLADAASQRLDFGVPARAQTLRDLTPQALTFHDPPGGPRSAGFAAALAYDWSDRWRTLLYSRYDRLLFEAARSPIVRRFGSTHQMSMGLGAVYSFQGTP